MIASTKGRYALRVLADMAGQEEGEWIPLSGIAQRQEISEKYLEAIVKLLVDKKLIEGRRGKGGGYRLSKPSSEYTVGEILRAAEGDIAPVACLVEGAEDCPRREGCATVKMWEKLDDLINGYLDGVTLKDLIQQ